MPGRKRNAIVAGSLIFGFGCAASRSPLPETAYLRESPPAPPKLPANDKPVSLPEAAKSSSVRPATGELTLDTVLNRVETHFPLLLSILEERGLASADRLTAEGAFDLTLRSGLTNQEGSFGNTRLDIQLDQPIAQTGANVFGGYRMGLGDFPVYNLGQKTASAGEFRGGVTVPLLRDRPIDRRRAALRQAVIAEQIADPVIRRAQLDFLRTASRAYWAWVAAGEQYRIAQDLLKLAEDRQAFFEGRLKAGNEDVIRVDDNRRSIFDRRGRLKSAERSFQQASLELSLYYRDDTGQTIVPTAAQLPAAFADLNPVPVGADQSTAAVHAALASRPELERLKLQKDRAAVELKLAMNQYEPALNVGAGFTQDVGPSKKSFSGVDIFASDKTSATAFATLEMPWQRREAQGRARRALIQMNQLAQQERYAQDLIRTEVLDAISAIVFASERLTQARLELAEADKVAANEKKRVLDGGRDVVDLNLRELNAAEARGKVVMTLAEFYRSFAEFRAATGQIAAGALPSTKPIEKK